MIEIVLSHALSGYLFLVRTYYFRSQINKLSGYHVLLRSAIVGLIISPVSYFLTCLIPFLLNEDLVIIARSLIAISLGLIAALIWNKFKGEIESEVDSTFDDNDMLGMLLIQCNVSGRMMEVTLKNRKVYAGYPATSSTKGNFISIFPLKSGHRTEDTLEVRYNTDYEWLNTPEAVSYLSTVNLKLEDFEVVVSKDEVISARVFDDDIWYEFDQLKQQFSR